MGGRLGPRKLLPLSCTELVQRSHVLRALGGRWRAFVKTLVTPPPSRWYSRVPRGSRSPQHPRGAAEFAIISTQNCLISTPPRFVIPGTLMHRMDDVFYLFLQKQKIALSHTRWVLYWDGMCSGCCFTWRYHHCVSPRRCKHGLRRVQQRRAPRGRHRQDRVVLL